MTVSRSSSLDLRRELPAWCCGPESPLFSDWALIIWALPSPAHEALPLCSESLRSCCRCRKLSRACYSRIAICCWILWCESLPRFISSSGAATDRVFLFSFIFSELGPPLRSLSPIAQI